MFFLARDIGTFVILTSNSVCVIDHDLFVVFCSAHTWSRKTSLFQPATYEMENDDANLTELWKTKDTIHRKL